MFHEQIARLFPQAKGARLEHGVVVIEKRATFSPVAGVDRCRPQQGPPAGGIGNLFLAGDYTRTHWPATMEGAVRSGRLAADAVVRCCRHGESERATFLTPDLPMQWPSFVVQALACPWATQAKA